MCGLTGIIYNSQIKNDNVNLKLMINSMTDSLISRGPDDRGTYIDECIALGHRRLKIQDLSQNGSQPMQIEENGPVIVFNGEIYNFKILRSKLEIEGCKFKSNSDTEVILHVYNQWGFEGLKKLEGIFAFAIWDKSRKKTILFRDRLGVKPLYYSDSKYGFVFGSEIKSLLKSKGINTSINDQALSEYLWYGNSYEDRSFYKNIKSVLPGQYIIINNTEKEIGNWWQIEEWINHNEDEYDLVGENDRVINALDQSVDRQLVSDVPVGIFLSGGIDSSGIAASINSEKKNVINSYSASFDFDKGIDESQKALYVSNYVGLNNQQLKIKGKNLQDVIIKLSEAHDEPFADAANIPLFLMCQELDPKVKVVLQGDGGDELFAGYIRYQILCYEKYFKFIPKFTRNLLLNFGIKGYRYARLLEAISKKDPGERMAFLLTLETEFKNPHNLFKTDKKNFIKNNTDSFLAYRNAANRFKKYNTVQKMLLTDLTVQLPCQFLTKVDRSTMAAGIEARVPMLDENLLKVALSMPYERKVNLREKKIVLRNSLRNRLPKSILDGPKTGFGVPYEHWVRSSLYEFARERILDDSFINGLHFRKDLIEKILIQHKNMKSENGFMIWKLLQLALWMSKRK